MTSLGTMEQNPSRQGRYTRQAKGAAEARVEHWRHGLAAKRHLAEALKHLPLLFGTRKG